MMTPWRLLLAIIIAVSIASAPAIAAGVKSVNWDDLLPAAFNSIIDEADELEAQLEELPRPAQEAFRSIGAQRKLRSNLKTGTFTVDDLMPYHRQMLDTDYEGKFPKAAFLADEADRLSAIADELDKQPNEELVGKVIRMPGYVLPLEFADASTTEFLLVPFVGACIHVPPPPPNQMVHVKYPRGFVSQGLYAPVYITGRLEAIGATVDLSLTDGNAPVETGYGLVATRIEPYKE